MQQFEKKIAEYVVFVYVIRINFFKHTFIYTCYLVHLFICQLKYMRTTGLKNSILIKVSKLVKKLRRKQTKKTTYNSISVFAAIRYLRVGEHQCLLLYFS